MSFSKISKFGMALPVVALLLLVGCTTDNDDDDGVNKGIGGVKGTLVTSKSSGDEVDGIFCEVSKSRSSAYLKVKQYIKGSYYVMDNEYRFEPNGDGFYTTTLFTDLEFENFPKSDAIALCKQLMEDADEEDGKSECGATGGHVELVLTKFAKPLSDETIDGLVEKCESMVDYFKQDYASMYDEDDDDLNKDQKSNSEVPNELDSSFGSDDFYCKVSQEDGKIYQRMKMTTLNVFSMTAVAVYEMKEDGNWYYTANFVLDGPGAAIEAKDLCDDNKEEYSSEIASGLATVTCGEKSVEVVERLGAVSPSLIEPYLQNVCDEMKNDYNGYDFDGPRKTTDELPTSCKVTPGESSFTLDLAYSDWAYSSTIQFAGTVAHEVELFSGNYGDRATRMCAYDKSDFENENVTCEDGKIELDTDWEGFTTDDVMELSQAMCKALLDGTMTFEDMME